jgi:hypothetical protein
VPGSEPKPRSATPEAPLESPGAWRAIPPLLELLGTAEVAARLGIAKSSLADRRRMPIFPKPVAELACGAIWTRAQIDEYRRRWTRGKHGSTYIWEEEWAKRPALPPPRPRLSGAEL